MNGHYDLHADGAGGVVSRGSVALFVVEQTDGADGVRHYAGTLKTGDAFFRVPIGSQPLRLVAIGSSETVVSAADGERPLQQWNWLSLLTEELARASPSCRESLDQLASESSTGEYFTAYFAHWQAHIEGLQAQRLRQRERRAHDEAQGVAESEHAFREIFERGAQAPVHPLHATHDPLTRAFARVLSALGEDDRSRGLRAAAPDLDEPRRLAWLAQRCGVRTRRVTLRNGWWRHESDPMVGFHGDGHAVALVRERERWLSIDADGTHTAISARNAGELRTDAYAVVAAFPSAMESVTDLLRFALRGSGFDARAIALYGALSGILALAVPVATGLLFGDIIPHGDRTLLRAMALLLGAAAFASAAFAVVQSFATLRVQTRLGARVQAALFDRLLSLPAAFFRRASAGDLTNRVMGLGDPQQLLPPLSVRLLLTSIFGFFSYGLIFFYSVGLGIVATVVAAATIAGTAVTIRRQLPYARRSFELQGQTRGLISQMLVGIAKLRTARAEKRAYRVWAESFAEQRRNALGFQTGQNALAILAAPLPAIAMLLLFAVGAAENRSGALSAEAFIAVVVAFMQFSAALLRAVLGVGQLVQAVPVFERSMEICRTAPEVRLGDADPPRLSGRMELNHVTFRYGNQQAPALDDVSLTVEPGEFVAIVGPSGAGKSTILRLLLGFELPERGAVLYDDRDLRTLDVSAVRRQIGTVLQDASVASGTIFENIVGSGNYSLDDAWEAARACGIAEDVEALPMGMRTIVTDGGSTFSGGQIQRLLIARALVRKPKLFFLDEATSALDNKTQSIVSEGIARIEATRIVIAHRLSTIVAADRICVIDGGRIVEAGDYRSLIDRGGIFARLAARQIV
ncbi:MAG TPA: NHLP bacteriocin export ABC transporter permease/ATPase subunit [Candidatus Baltobacteraceae bacterium]|nr:NHLP bacteriocin export ABC transporter permease/ATPase subunit [Candidatus Baltobacteraceae bacterium]